jgi:hypothetical protein
MSDRPLPSQSKRVVAWVAPSDPMIPGLVNVETSEGERFHDLTMSQFKQLVAERGWDVRVDR